MRRPVLPIVFLAVLVCTPSALAGERGLRASRSDASPLGTAIQHRSKRLEARYFDATRILRPLGPKVVVTAVSAPSEPVGDLMQPHITVTIENVGLSPAEGYRIEHSASVFAYLQEPYPGPFHLGSLTLGIAHLAPGQSLTYSFPVSGIPAEWHPMPIVVAVEVFRTPQVRDYGYAWLMGSGGNPGSAWAQLP